MYLPPSQVRFIYGPSLLLHNLHRRVEHITFSKGGSGSNRAIDGHRDKDPIPKLLNQPVHWIFSLVRPPTGFAPPRTAARRNLTNVASSPLYSPESLRRTSTPWVQHLYTVTDLANRSKTKQIRSVICPIRGIIRSYDLVAFKNGSRAILCQFKTFMHFLDNLNQTPRHPVDSPLSHQSTRTPQMAKREVPWAGWGPQGTNCTKLVNLGPF